MNLKKTEKKEKEIYLPWSEVRTSLGKLPSPCVILTPEETVSLFKDAKAMPEYLQNNMNFVGFQV